MKISPANILNTLFLAQLVTSFIVMRFPLFLRTCGDQEVFAGDQG